MAQQRYIRTPEGEIVSLPTPVQPSESVENDIDNEEDPIGDIVNVDDEDIMGYGYNEDGLSDIVEVSDEDIIGRRPQPPSRYRIPPRRYQPPPSSLGRMR